MKTTTPRAKTFKALVTPKTAFVTDSALKTVGRFKGLDAKVVNTIVDTGECIRITGKQKGREPYYLDKSERTFAFFEGKTPRSMKQI